MDALRNARKSNNKMKTTFNFLMLFFCMVLISCSTSDDGTEVTDDDDDSSAGVSTPTAAFDEFNPESVTISFDGDEITIHSNALPNHTSPYWSQNSDLYIDPVIANETQMSPGDITESSYTLTVSAAPGIATNSTETGLGAIGISISGVPIFNGSEGPTDLSSTVASGMDWAGGHSGPTGYHYHIEASGADENNGVLSYDDHQLVGIMSDGFLLYGRRDNEDGDYPDDLDESGGHFGLTEHSDEPFYHYHIVNEIYLNQYYLLFGFVDLKGTPSVIM